MRYKLVLIILMVLPLNACGFSVVKNTEKNFNVIEVSTSGDKRINYIIKNKLSVNSSNVQTKDLLITIDSAKNKVVKEKNIKNEITKYEITINVNVVFNVIENAYKDQFSISKTSDYKVESQHTQTLNNEKKTIRSLSESIGDNVLNDITRRLNDI